MSVSFEEYVFLFPSPNLLGLDTIHMATYFKKTCLKCCLRQTFIPQVSYGSCMIFKKYLTRSKYKELKKNWKSKNFPRHERIPRFNTFKRLLLLEEEKFLIKKKIDLAVYRFSKKLEKNTPGLQLWKHFVSIIFRLRLGKTHFYCRW